MEMEGLVPCTPNAVISISYIRSISLCNEYVTNLFFHFQTALSPWPQVWIANANILKFSHLRKCEGSILRFFSKVVKSLFLSCVYNQHSAF